MIFPFLSFLQVSNGSAAALSILLNLITAGIIIDFMIICITYIFFYRACQAQGIDRKSLPYCGWFQPYCAWIGLVVESVIVFFFGYSSFMPFTASSFFSYYTMAIVDPILYIAWKLWWKTKVVQPKEAGK